VIGELFASAPLFRSTSLSASGIPGEHLLELLIEPELLEQGALFAPDLVRDRGGPGAIFEREDVGRVTVLQPCRRVAGLFSRSA
jgi:hypothetical protein